MIVHWYKNDKNEKNTKSLFYPSISLNSSFNSLDSIELNENDYLNQNNSFLNEDYDLVFDICKEIESNNSSDTRIISNEEINFNVENSQTENSVINIEKEINLCFVKKTINENKLIQLFHICNNNYYLHNILLNNIISNIVELLNNNKNIFEPLFNILNENEKEELLIEIVKHTDELIINKNGYLVLQFIIFIKRINIINSILYFILQNFIFYCLNDYSSEIICQILSMGIFFSKNYIVEKIKDNYEIMRQHKNGIKIMKNAQKYFHNFYIY
jgi:hypothetical protein